MPPMHRSSASTVNKVSNSLKRPLDSFLAPELALHTGTTLPQTAIDKTAPQIKCCLLDITLFLEEPVIFCETEKRDLFIRLLWLGPVKHQWKISIFPTANPFCNVAIHETSDATGSFQTEGLKKQIVTIELSLNTSTFFANSRQFQPIIHSHNTIIVFGRISNILRESKRLSTGDFRISQLIGRNKVKFTVVSP